MCYGFGSNSRTKSRGWWSVVTGHPHTTPRLLSRQTPASQKSTQLSILSTIFFSQRLLSFSYHILVAHSKISRSSTPSQYLRDEQISLSLSFCKPQSTRQVPTPATVCVYSFMSIFIYLFFPFPLPSSPSIHNTQQVSPLGSRNSYRELVFRLRSILARMTFTRPCV
jgi:hypothetical protein